METTDMENIIKNEPNEKNNLEEKIPVKCGDKIFYFDSETAKELEEAFVYYKEFLKG
jgi:hypothetical protein